LTYNTYISTALLHYPTQFTVPGLQERHASPLHVASIFGGVLAPRQQGRAVRL